MNHWPNRRVRRRSSFSFTLRTLFFFVVLLSLPFGWIGQRREQFRQQSIAIRAVERNKGIIGRVELVSPPSQISKAILGDSPGNDVSLIEFSGQDVEAVDFSKLRSLPNLKSLSIHWSEIRSPSFEDIADLRQIEILSLDGAPISDTELGMLKCRGLKDLRLGQTPITDRGIADLERFKSLEKLTLAYTKVSSEGLRHVGKCMSLRELRIIASPIDDAGLSHLAGLNALEILDLSETDITGESISVLAQLPRLRELRLSSTKLTAKGCDQISRLGHLDALDLSNTKITENEIACLRPLGGNLRRLDIYSTPITDEAVAQLRAFENLRYLNLRWTSITDKSLTYLADHSNLQGLSIADTNVTDSGILEVVRMPALVGIGTFPNRSVTEAGRDALRKRIPKLSVN